MEELFDNTKDRLPDFLIVRRSLSTHVDKIKPIGNSLGNVIQREINIVFQIVVRFKIETIRVLPNMVSGEQINKVDVEALHVYANSNS
jgi:hypothetical protein